MSWFLYNKNKNINLLFNNDSQLLIKNLSEINDINKYIQFNNGNVILIDVIRYKINLEEYYVNKNPQEKKDLFRVDIILSSPINFINNTPYEFIVNNVPDYSTGLFQCPEVVSPSVFRPSLKAFSTSSVSSLSSVVNTTAFIDPHSFNCEL